MIPLLSHIFLKEPPNTLILIHITVLPQPLTLRRAVSYSTASYIPCGLDHQRPLLVFKVDPLIFPEAVPAPVLLISVNDTPDYSLQLLPTKLYCQVDAISDTSQLPLLSCTYKKTQSPVYLMSKHNASPSTSFCLCCLQPHSKPPSFFT